MPRVQRCVPMQDHYRMSAWISCCYLMLRQRWDSRLHVSDGSACCAVHPIQLWSGSESQPLCRSSSLSGLHVLLQRRRLLLFTCSMYLNLQWCTLVFVERSKMGCFGHLDKCMSCSHTLLAMLNELEGSCRWCLDFASLSSCSWSYDCNQ